MEYIIAGFTFSIIHSDHFNTQIKLLSPSKEKVQNLIAIWVDIVLESKQNKRFKRIIVAK